MANGAPPLPSQLQQAAAAAAGATQLQQRAAAAAQFLSAERKISTREIQAMLEKNDAALRGWNALHAQEPPKTLVKEHKEWIRRCMALRQQVGARLEVLASLADKQIAIEDESSAQTVKPLDKPPVAAAAAQPAAHVTAKKVKTASAAQTRQQPAPTKAKPAPAATAAATPARSSAASSDSSSTGSVAQMPAASAVPVPSPTSFPEPPMPTAVAAQQFGFPAATGANDPAAFFGAGQNAAMTSAGFGDASMQSFSMSAGAAPFGGNGFANPATAFMSQQPNYMMNPAAMNPMAMMNPQFLAMQMQMQNQMPGMNMAGAMYNANPMFNGYGMDGSQLPVDPFNSSFGQAGTFPGQPQFNPLTGSFDTLGGMQPAGMMSQMSAFPMMPDPMLMNAFPYGMGLGQQQQSQPPQQQQPTSSANGQFPNAGAGAAQAFPMPAELQHQQQQQPPQPEQPAAPGDFPETSLFDDAMASNLFDGFPEDAFLQM